MATNALSAGARVANTFELLEQILLRIAEFPDDHGGKHPVQRLLALENVNRTFRDTISNSELLQRTLFLSPPTTTDATQRGEFNNFLWLVDYFYAEATFNYYATDLSKPTNLEVMIGILSWPYFVHGHKDASWRKMHLLSIPYTIESLKVSIPSGGFTFWTVVLPSNDENATLGELWEDILKHPDVATYLKERG